MTALPVASSTAAPMVRSPLFKLTLPDGMVPEGTAETATWKVTDCPNKLGFNRLVKFTDGTARWTTWLRLTEEPPTKLALPLKIASSAWSPAAVKVTGRLAVPAEFTEEVPSVVPPSVKVIEPESVPLPENFGCTVAVIMTWPNTADGLIDEASVTVFAP